MTAWAVPERIKIPDEIRDADAMQAAAATDEGRELMTSWLTFADGFIEIASDNLLAVIGTAKRVRDALEVTP